MENATNALMPQQSTPVATPTKTTYVLYARKSTESEERAILNENVEQVRTGKAQRYPDLASGHISRNDIEIVSYEEANFVPSSDQGTRPDY